MEQKQLKEYNYENQTFQDWNFVQEHMLEENIHRMNIIQCGDIPEHTFQFIPILRQQLLNSIKILNLKKCVLQNHMTTQIMQLPSLLNLNITQTEITKFCWGLNTKECKLKVLSIGCNFLGMRPLPFSPKTDNTSYFKIENLPYLEVLDMYNTGLYFPLRFSNNMKALKQDQCDFSRSPEVLNLYKNCEKLIIDFCQIRRLNQIDGETKIKQLSLRGNQLTREAVSVIVGIKPLQELVLQECGLDWLPDFHQLENLWNLNLSGNKLSKINSFQNLFEHLKLTVLSLGNCEITNGLDNIDISKSLIQNLNIAKNNIPEQTLGHISGLKDLSQYEIHGTVIENQEIVDYICTRPKMAVLNFNGVVGVKKIQCLSPSITQLWIAGTGIPEDDISHFSLMQNVKKLNVRKCKLSNQQLGIIFALPNLELIELNYEDFVKVPPSVCGKKIIQIDFGNDQSFIPPEWQKVIERNKDYHQTIMAQQFQIQRKQILVYKLQMIEKLQEIQLDCEQMILRIKKLLSMQFFQMGLAEENIGEIKNEQK